jgi:predicted dienelactone hydrolase
MAISDRIRQRILARRQGVQENTVVHRLIDVQAFSQYSPEVIEALTFVDDQRHREIPLNIYYPRERNKYPILFFSHGAGGSRLSYDYLGRYWASHGYIAIHPTHIGSDSSLLGKQRGLGFQLLKDIIDDPQQWQDRVQDISALIDSLPLLEQKVPVLAGKLDRSSIGVAGHSFGAHTVMLLAGANLRLPNGAILNLKDERICAFLAISPQGTGRQGFDRHSWEMINRPMMLITGPEDRGLMGETAQWRQQSFDYMALGDKCQILIQRASHFSFAEDQLGLVNRDRQRQVHSYVQDLSLAFWHTYLQPSPSTLKLLDSLKLPADNRGEITVLQK